MSTANRHKSASVHEMPESDSLFDDLALRRELSANLVGFCRSIRLIGLRTGMGEQMDALRALEEVDLKLETVLFYKLLKRCANFCTAGPVRDCC